MLDQNKILPSAAGAMSVALVERLPCPLDSVVNTNT